MLPLINSNGAWKRLLFSQLLLICVELSKIDSARLLRMNSLLPHTKFSRVVIFKFFIVLLVYEYLVLSWFYFLKIWLKHGMNRVFKWLRNVLFISYVCMIPVHFWWTRTIAKVIQFYVLVINVMVILYLFISVAFLLPQSCILFVFTCL